MRYFLFTDLVVLELPWDERCLPIKYYPELRDQEAVIP